MKKIKQENIERFFDLELDLCNRVLLLHDFDHFHNEDTGLSSHMFVRFLKGFHVLSSRSRDPIRIILHSKGGDWDAGMAIYDLLKSSQCHTTIEVLGVCASAATLILQAADVRLSHENVTFMVHDGNDGFLGNSKSFESWGKHSKKIREKMYAIYAERTTKTKEFWERSCSSDLILSPETALSIGFIDTIVKSTH